MKICCCNQDYLISNNKLQIYSQRLDKISLKGVQLQYYEIGVAGRRKILNESTMEVSIPGKNGSRSRGYPLPTAPHTNQTVETRTDDRIRPTAEPERMVGLKSLLNVIKKGMISPGIIIDPTVYQSFTTEGIINASKIAIMALMISPRRIIGVFFSLSSERFENLSLDIISLPNVNELISPRESMVDMIVARMPVKNSP